MGRAYQSELDRMQETYEWAAGIPIDVLRRFVEKSRDTPLYAIGSGGSFSAAVFASMLHQRTGIISKCPTPLEFLGYENVNPRCSILIISAGGGNPDILASFERAIRIRPENLGVMCADRESMLVRKADMAGYALVHAARPPAGRDGFLATNSLLSMMVWLFRAYAGHPALPDAVPEFGKVRHDVQGLAPLEEADTLVVLYDNWGKAAAVDAESKMTEAGLIGVQPADYRNFAHGRHNWLDKRDRTGLVALVDPHCRMLAARTTRLIPDSVPVITFETDMDGPMASVALMMQVFLAVGALGRMRGIDPGRPRVADFGRRLYNLSVPGDPASSMNA